MTTEQRLTYLNKYMEEWVSQYPKLCNTTFETWLSAEIMRMQAKATITAKRKARREREKAVWANCGSCAYCGKSFANKDTIKTVDHVIPVSKGGGNDKRNLVSCCLDCNQWKGDMYLEEWMEELKVLYKNRLRFPQFPSTIVGMIQRISSHVGHRKSSIGLLKVA